MKKMVSSIVSAAMAVSMVSAVSASADGSIRENDLSITTEVLNNATVVNGTYIPAGATAVTVSIANNTGFSSSTITLDMDSSYTPVKDTNGLLITSVSDSFENFDICGVSNNSKLAVSLASSSVDADDGDIFTFYVTTETNESVDMNVLDVELASLYNTNFFSTSMATRSVVYFRYGDVNFDGLIDPVDASLVYYAISQYHISHSGVLPVSEANTNLPFYFGSSNTLCAQAADPILSGSISNADAKDILYYNACQASGENYSDYSDGLCGTYSWCNL